MSADKTTLKKMMAKLPHMIQKSIFERTPILFLLNWVEDNMDEWQNDAFHSRFEAICRSNNVTPTNGANTRWGLEFVRFLKSRRAVNMSGNLLDDLEYTNLMASLYPDLYSLDEIVITGEVLDLWEYKDFKLSQFPTSVEVSFDLTRPQRQRKGLCRRTMVLSREYVDGKTARFNYMLGNRHDLMVQKDEPMLKFNTMVQFDHPQPKIAFDENDHLYFVDKASGILTVFWKDLESTDPPKPVFRLNRTCESSNVMCAGYGRIFLDAILPDNKWILYSYETRTGKVCSTPVTQLWDDEPYCIVPHGDCVALGESMDSTTIYTLTKDGFEKSEIESYIRNKLNRDTYMYLVGREQRRSKAYIFSIVEGRVIEHFLMECEELAYFGKHTENIFYLMEKNRRHVWFVENPGDKPLLLFADDAGHQQDLYKRRAY